MRKLVYSVAVGLALAACGALVSSEVEGSWVLESGQHDGQAITLVDSHPITLTLDGGELSGTASCNGYGGSYSVSGASFEVGEMSWTEMACSPPETMEAEQEYLMAFLGVDRAEVIDERLVLSGPITELAFSALEGEPAAAEDPPDDPVAGPPSLFGLEVFGSWELISGEADGEPIPIVDSHPITVDIDENGVGGTAACNQYFGTPGGDGFAVTEMACGPDEVMESESAYLAALARVTESGVGEQLVLSGEGVELVFRPLFPVPEADLLNTVWVLESLIQGEAVTSTVPDSRATLELFSDGSFIGSTGCRTIAGSYVINGAEVVFTSWGAEGVCPVEMIDQDGRITSALEGGFRVQITEDRMTTWVRGNEGLVYRAEQ